jgi:hypothetical protein
MFDNNLDLFAANWLAGIRERTGPRLLCRFEFSSGLTDGGDNAELLRDIFQKNLKCAIWFLVYDPCGTGVARSCIFVGAGPVGYNFRGPTSSITA